MDVFNLVGVSAPQGMLVSGGGVGEGDLRSGSKIGSTVAGVGVVGAKMIHTVSRSSLTPSTLMTHEMDPTMKIWPGCGRDEEPIEKAILFDEEIAH